MNKSSDKLSVLKHLIDSIPGKKSEQVARAAEMVGASEQTVRTWLCTTQNRPIPDKRLSVLGREVKRLESL